jgi:hypothetical protein
MSPSQLRSGEKWTPKTGINDIQVTEAEYRWSRLYKVQRRVRHIRRVAATLLNHTKGWSSLRWGQNTRTAGAYYEYISNAKRVVEENPKCQRSIVKLGLNLIFGVLSFIYWIIVLSVKITTKFGSFCVGLKTILVWVKIILNLATLVDGANIALSYAGVQPKQLAYAVKYGLWK